MLAEGPFVGTLPCADCAGIRTELLLYRDAASGKPARFLLRETYLGKPRGDGTVESSGPWQEIEAGGAGPQGRRVRVDPYQPASRRNFLRLSPAALQLLDRDERPIDTRAELRLHRAVAAPPDETPTPALLAGTLHAAGPEGLRLQRCGGGEQRAIDVSPENMVTAVLTDIGLDRHGSIYVEVFGRVVDGNVMIERLNRAGAEMRCPNTDRGPRWQAQGNEPFWALRAEADRTTFTQPGEAPVAHPSIDLTWRWSAGRRDQARAYLQSQTESGRFEAVLTPRICRDTMADAAFGYRAEVTLTDARSRRTFAGCAYLGVDTSPP